MSTMQASLVKRFLIVFVLLGLILLSPVPVFAYSTFMPASLVVGQTDVTSNSTSVSQSQLGNSVAIRGVFVDPKGRMIISDTSRNRVLIWNKVPTTNGVPADLVLGQANFTSSSLNGGGSEAANTMSSPIATWSDGERLIVVDPGINHRVLLWNTFPTTNGQAADVVIGQSDMTSATTTCDPTHLSLPYGAFVYNGKLIVTSRSQNRVLIWNSIPTTNGEAANIVLGQTDLNTCSSPSAAANTFSGPRGVWVDNNGKLYVADTLYQRILIWNTFPTTNNQSANVVVGQPNFTSSTSSTSSSALTNPSDMAVANNRLFVADPTNGRALIYNSIPTSNGQNADIVIGQRDFVTVATGVTSQQIAGPNTIFATNNQLFVGDTANARVLIFNNVVSTPQISLTTPPTSIGSGRYRLLGNINMNNNGGTYSLQTLQADLNGTGYGNITFPGGRSDGGGNTIYDFIYDFDPTVGGGSINDNLTLKFLASTFNADTNTLFYFLPFNLKSVTKNQIVFNVNKTQLNKIKDNISHFEVWNKTSTSSLWTKYIDNILPTQIDSNGDVYINKLNSLTSVSYKVKAVDNWNNSQESNILSFSSTSNQIPVNSFVSFTGSPVASSEPTPIPLESPIPNPEPTQTPEFISEIPQINNYLKYIIPAGIILLVLFAGIVILKRKR